MPKEVRQCGPRCKVEDVQVLVDTLQKAHDVGGKDVDKSKLAAKLLIEHWPHASVSVRWGPRVEKMEALEKEQKLWAEVEIEGVVSDEGVPFPICALVKK